MVSAKIMWNSDIVISTPGVKFGGADIKNMYLEMPLDWYKCPSSSSPLTSLNTTICGGKHSMAMFKWRFDMACTGYHKPNKLLTQCLGRHGYFEVQHTPSCWKHISCPIWFNLYVENFGIKNIGDENLNHLFKAPPHWNIWDCWGLGK